MYSVNQVNQMYVVSAVTNNAITNASNDGTMRRRVAADGSFQYFQYKSKGGLMATDRIKKRKVKSITYTPAVAMRKPLKKWTIAFNSGVNSGNPVAGQDYILDFAFDHYFGMSDEDIYNKFASARAFSTTASDVLAALAVSLAKNFSREVDMPFNIFVTASSTKTAVTPTTKADDLSSVTNIILEEVVQPWNLGRYKQTRPNFRLTFSPVTYSGVEYSNWGTVTEAEQGDSYFIGNGAETADLEWFCMGERGDQYRGKDWPLSITTPASLMVDASKEYNYLIIHFWDDIDNEGPQKSERDMTLVWTGNSTDPLIALAAAVATDAGLDHYIAVQEVLDNNQEGTGVYAPVAVTVGLAADVADIQATLKEGD